MGTEHQEEDIIMSKNDDYFNWSASEGYPKPIKNDDLVCKDCIYKNRMSVLQCLKYPDEKPGKVLYGKGCDKY
jgi:hypothetical protein